MVIVEVDPPSREVVPRSNAEIADRLGIALGGAGGGAPCQMRVRRLAAKAQDMRICRTTGGRIIGTAIGARGPVENRLGLNRGSHQQQGKGRNVGAHAATMPEIARTAKKKGAPGALLFRS